MIDGDTVFEPRPSRGWSQPFADPSVGAVAGNAKVANRRGLIGRWQHIEYVIGFNLDRRVYDVWRCMPTVPGAVGAFRRRRCSTSAGSATTRSPRTPTSPWRSAGPAGGWCTRSTRGPGPRRRRRCASCGGSATGGATGPCSRCGSTAARCSTRARRAGSAGSGCPPRAVPGGAAAARAAGSSAVAEAATARRLLSHADRQGRHGRSVDERTRSLSPGPLDVRRAGGVRSGRHWQPGGPRGVT